MSNEPTLTIAARQSLEPLIRNYSVLFLPILIILREQELSASVRLKFGVSLSHPSLLSKFAERTSDFG